MCIASVKCICNIKSVVGLFWDLLLFHINWGEWTICSSDLFREKKTGFCCCLLHWFLCRQQLERFAPQHDFYVWFWTDCSSPCGQRSSVHLAAHTGRTSFALKLCQFIVLIFFLRMSVRFTTWLLCKVKSSRLGASVHSVSKTFSDGALWYHQCNNFCELGGS